MVKLIPYTTILKNIRDKKQHLKRRKIDAYINTTFLKHRVVNLRLFYAEKLILDEIRRIQVKCVQFFLPTKIT